MTDFFTTVMEEIQALIGEITQAQELIDNEPDETKKLMLQINQNISMLTVHAMNNNLLLSNYIINGSVSPQEQELELPGEEEFKAAQNAAKSKMDAWRAKREQNGD